MQICLLLNSHTEQITGAEVLAYKHKHCTLSGKTNNYIVNCTCKSHNCTYNDKMPPMQHIYSRLTVKRLKQLLCTKLLQGTDCKRDVYKYYKIPSIGGSKDNTLGDSEILPAI